MIEITFEELDYNFLVSNSNKLIKICLDQESFYFKFSYKNDSSKLVVHSNGALDWEKTTPPLAMRATWSNSIDANCIFLDDKTIHNDKLTLGWGAGKGERFYLEDYSKIAKRIQNILEINSKNVYYWGSSAGGYMSMVLASMHEESTAIVNNPQTLLENYYRMRVQYMLDVVFPGLSREEIRMKYPERISVVAAFQKYGYIPKLYYIQNSQYEKDFVNHYQGFRNECLKNNISESKFMYILYNDYERGHGPLTKNATLEYLHWILNIKFL